MDAGLIGITVIFVLATITLIYEIYRIATDTDTYDDNVLGFLCILIALSTIVTFFLTVFD